MKHDQVIATLVHPLELNDTERDWFQSSCANYVTAYRRAVQVLTGSLPSWAEPKVAGRPQAIANEHHYEIRELLALGVPVSTVARRFNTSRATISRIRDGKGHK